MYYNITQTHIVANNTFKNIYKLVYSKWFSFSYRKMYLVISQNVYIDETFKMIPGIRVECEHNFGFNFLLHKWRYGALIVDKNYM